jgi:Sec-independent protein translocase protein TatA
MTLLDTERLIRRISDVLQPGGNQDAAPRLADDFASACHAANLRLQQCEAMIRAHDRLQAIQLAETAPNLLDFIALLEFRNAGDWRAFCQKNALPVAERIDSRALQSLHQCYAQGISTDHPLYAAFRKATLTRNDTEAHAALRAITRLNPSDANAAGELARVDEKLLAARLEHLGAVLAGGDAALIVAEIEKIESFGFKSRPEGEVWRKAALVRCGVLIEEAIKARSAAQWVLAFNKLELIRRLQKELSLELTQIQLQQLAELEKWVRGEQEKDRQNREFAAQLSELQRQIHKSEEKDTSARYVELPEMRADFEALNKAWRALTDFTRPIPDDATAAFRKRSALLEGEIARRMAVRRRTILAGATAALLVIAVVVWIVLGQMKAHQFARELENAVSQRQTRLAERTLETLHTTEKRMLSAKSVNAAVAHAESFIAKETALLTNFNDTLAKLPTRLSSDVDAKRVSTIGAQVAQTHAALNALSPDLKAENEPRLNAFEQQWQQYLSNASLPVNNAFEQVVTLGENQCRQLDYRAPDKAAVQLSSLSDSVQKLNEQEAAFTNYIQMRSDLLQRASAVQARFDAFHRELKKLNDGMASLKQARTLGDFSSAVGSMASSEFSSAPAAVAANTVQNLGISEELILRSLLNATNPATWAFIKKGKSPTLIPEIALPAERTSFQQLMADPALNAKHQRYRFWLNPEKTKNEEWITVGALDGSLGWKTISAWTVSYDGPVTFTDHNYGFFNGQWKLSASQPIYNLDRSPNLTEAAPFRAAELGKVWGGAESYNQPLLQAIDAARDSSDGSPICRAYLICRLAKMMELQPDEWGLTFCPSLRADVAQIQKIVAGEISSGDWFVPSKTNAWNTPLNQFLSTTKSSSYQKQATGNLILAQAAVRDGLRYVGYADVDGKPVITASQSPTEIWGYDATGKKPTIIHDAAMPFSPLFALPLSRAEYLAKASIDPNAPSFANNALLPLFRANN